MAAPLLAGQLLGGDGLGHLALLRLHEGDEREHGAPGDSGQNTKDCEEANQAGQGEATLHKRPFFPTWPGLESNKRAPRLIPSRSRVT